MSRYGETQQRLNQMFFGTAEPLIHEQTCYCNENGFDACRCVVDEQRESEETT